VAQEFTIKSEAIESKINQLLPSQGGFQAGVDFSASTMVIPIVDLTETAEGSDLRQDLQTALSHNSATEFNVTNTTTTVINTTGYWRVIGSTRLTINNSLLPETSIIVNDGATDKILTRFYGVSSTVVQFIGYTFDFNVKLEAGDSLKVKSASTASVIGGSIRQIADINGNLINP
jgi:hypothetical protein